MEPETTMKDTEDEKKTAWILEYQSQSLCDDLKLWCSNIGDVFNPDDPDRIIDYRDLQSELPEQVFAAYKTLWSDTYSVDCYVAEFKGEYKLALVAELDYVCDALNAYRKLAQFYSMQKEFQDSGIVLVENCQQDISELIILLPWNISRKNVRSISDILEQSVYAVRD